MSVLIVDYGMCNLGSVKRAFEECGADAFISDHPKDAEQASHIVLPGVGAFGDAMKNLISSGWDVALRK
ncbi:MAG: imidazole glycerol phosphate synthase subunit HisH, partial [Cyclobacteriaceae bacterium]|nr:imidazole glycerol phosphate synthase subunit HisH [Cyclobacteriaceae bacterium]